MYRLIRQWTFTSRILRLPGVLFRTSPIAPLFGDGCYENLKKFQNAVNTLANKANLQWTVKPERVTQVEFNQGDPTIITDKAYPVQLILDVHGLGRIQGLNTAKITAVKAAVAEIEVRD